MPEPQRGPWSSWGESGGWSGAGSTAGHVMVGAGVAISLSGAAAPTVIGPPRRRTMRTMYVTPMGVHLMLPSWCSSCPPREGLISDAGYLMEAMLRRWLGSRTLHVRAATAACALLLMSGCAKTTVTDEQYYRGPRLAKPARILVYDFAASQADLPAGYGTAVSAPPVDQTADDLSLGRKLGAEVGKDLVEELQKIGLPAVSANAQPPPQLNDIAVIG